MENSTSANTGYTANIVSSTTVTTVTTSNKRANPTKRRDTNKDKKKRQAEQARLIKETEHNDCYYPIDTPDDHRLKVSCCEITHKATRTNRPKSWVWNHFHIIKDKPLFAACDICVDRARAKEDDGNIM